MAKHSAFGAILSVGTTSVIASATYTAIAQIDSITPGEPSTEKVDVSTHDDATRYRTFVQGRIDPGEYEISGVLDPANATHFGADGLSGLAATGETRAFKLTLPDTGATVVAFQGFVMTFGIGELAQDDALRFRATIAVTGAQTYDYTT